MKIPKLLILILFCVQNIITSDFEIAKRINSKLWSLSYDIESYLSENKFYENVIEMFKDIELKKDFFRKLEESLKDLPTYKDLLFYVPINHYLSLIVDNYLKFILSRSKEVFEAIINKKPDRICKQYRFRNIQLACAKTIIFNRMSLFDFLNKDQCIIL